MIECASCVEWASCPFPTPPTPDSRLPTPDSRPPHTYLGRIL
ncbi:hypothetical protein [Moorena sp. SIO3I8]|nr:hypothetical protein [Moorena sp. SIO3I8]